MKVFTWRIDTPKNKLSERSVSTRLVLKSMIFAGSLMFRWARFKTGAVSSLVLRSMKRGGYQSLSMKMLAAERSSYSYLFMHALLKQEGLVINDKRTYCVYWEKKPRGAHQYPKKIQRRHRAMRWSSTLVASSRYLFLPEWRHFYCNRL